MIFIHFDESCFNQTTQGPICLLGKKQPTVDHQNVKLHNCRFIGVELKPMGKMLCDLKSSNISNRNETATPDWSATSQKPIRDRLQVADPPPQSCVHCTWWHRIDSFKMILFMLVHFLVSWCTGQLEAGAPADGQGAALRQHREGRPRPLDAADRLRQARRARDAGRRLPARLALRHLPLQVGFTGFPPTRSGVTCALLGFL